MNDFTLTVREFRFVQKSFWRDRQSVIFNVGLPLLYLFIFASVFGNTTGTLAGQPGVLKGKTIYAASIIVIGVISATFQSLAGTLVEERENGVLKRLRSTPLRTTTFIAGHVASAIVVALLLSALVLILGRVLYGVGLPGATMPAALVAVLVGAVSFSCLGFAFTLLIREAQSAVAMILGVSLTLFFISGNFFTVDHAPQAFRTVANLFPVRHFDEAVLTALNPHTTGMGFQWWDLTVVALWGLAGLLVAIRFFRWNPTGE